MVTFVDTSAIFALLDKRDRNHNSAVTMWERQLAQGATLVTTNYVLLETVTLLQRRLGSKPVRDVQERIVPLLDVEWVDSATHEIAMRRVVFSGERGVSLVDATSFEAMRKRNLERVFTFDHHFADEGFDLVP